jgi:hypothetical protein
MMLSATQRPSSLSEAFLITLISSPCSLSVHISFLILIFVFKDQLIGCLDDVLRRAVVLLQLEYFQIREIFLEVKYVIYRSSAEGIDRLRIIAHDSDILKYIGDALHNRVLEEVGILKLIYQYVLKFVLVLIQHIRKALQYLVRFEQQVIKVHCATLETAVAVFGIDAGGLRSARFANLR